MRNLARFMLAAVLAGWTAGGGFAAAAPAQVGNVRAQAGNTAVSLVWEASPPGENVSAYVIYQDGGEVGRLQGSPPESATLLSNLVNGTAYALAVSAVNAAGEGPLSVTVTAIPAVLPLAPAGLTATAASAPAWQVGLTWSQVVQETFPVTGYAIYRETTPTAVAASFFVTAPATEYLDAAVSATGTANAYLYRVAAVDSQGNTGPASAQVSAPTTLAGAPAAPGAVTATAQDGAVALAWDAVSGAEGYRLFYTATPGAGEVAINTPAASANVSPLVNDVRYYFYVASLLGNSLSARTTATAVPRSLPGPVAGLLAYGGAGFVKLTWNAAGGGTTAYRVYRADYDPNSTTPYAVTGAPEFLDTGVVNGLAYPYAVSAVNPLGEGPLSAAVYATPTANALPVPPSAFQAQVGLSASVDLSWSNPEADALTGYVLYRDGNYLGDLPGDAATTRVAQGLSNGTVYAFSLQARKPAGLSNTVTVQAQPLAAPVALATQVQADSILLSWVAGDTTGAVYSLYQTDSGYGQPVLLTTTAGAAYAHNHLANGAYFYKLTASNGLGQTIPDALALTATANVAVPPYPPEQLQLISGDRQVEIIWRSVSNASAYYLYRSLDANQFGVPIQNIQPTENVTVDGAGLTNTVRYYYAMTAVNDAGESTRSAQSWAIPFRPPQLPPDPSLRTAQLRKSVRLEWNASVPGDYPIVGYNLYRSEDGGGTFALLGASPTLDVGSATITSYAYVDLDVDYGAAYYYRVHALDFDAANLLYHEGPAYPLAQVVLQAPTNHLEVLRNAFNPALQEFVPIQLYQVQPGRVWIKIYNLAGEHVRTLFDQDIPPGFSPAYPFIALLQWDGRNERGETVASGVYLIHAEGQSRYHQTRKVAVIK